MSSPETPVVPSYTAEVQDYLRYLGDKTKSLCRGQGVDGVCALVRKSVSDDEAQRAEAAPALAELLKPARLRDATMRSEEVRRVVGWHMTIDRLKGAESYVSLLLPEENKSVAGDQGKFLNLYFEFSKLAALAERDEETNQNLEDILRSKIEELRDTPPEEAVYNFQRDTILFLLHRIALKREPPLLGVCEEILKYLGDPFLHLAKIEHLEKMLPQYQSEEERANKINERIELTKDEIRGVDFDQECLPHLFTALCRLLTLRRPDQTEERDSDSDFNFLTSYIAEASTYFSTETGLRILLEYYAAQNEREKMVKIFKRSSTVSAAEFYFAKGHEICSFLENVSLFPKLFTILQKQFAFNLDRYNYFFRYLSREAIQLDRSIFILSAVWNWTENIPLTAHIFAHFLKAGLRKQKIEEILKELGRKAQGYEGYKTLFTHLHQTGQYAEADKWLEAIQDPFLKARVTVLRGHLEAESGNEQEARKYLEQGASLYDKIKYHSNWTDTLLYEKYRCLISLIKLSSKLGEKKDLDPIKSVVAFLTYHNSGVQYIETVLEFIDCLLPDSSQTDSVRFLLSGVKSALRSENNKIITAQYLPKIAECEYRFNGITSLKNVFSSRDVDALALFPVLLGSDGLKNITAAEAAGLFQFILNSIPLNGIFPKELIPPIVAIFAKRRWLKELLAATWPYKGYGYGTLRGEIVKALMEQGELNEVLLKLGTDSKDNWRTKPEDDSEEFRTFIKYFIAGELAVIKHADPRLTPEQKLAPGKFLQTVAEGRF